MTEEMLQALKKMIRTCLSAPAPSTLVFVSEGESGFCFCVKTPAEIKMILVLPVGIQRPD